MPFAGVPRGRAMAVSVALEDPSPALGVGKFREIQRKVWIIPRVLLLARSKS